MKNEESLKRREKVSKMIGKNENIKENKGIILKESKGITLISLVVTIVVLIVLAGITITFLLGNNSVIKKASDAREETQKQSATEIMNLKITNVQIAGYAEKQRMPTLKELADNFCDDNDFEYVQETSKIASLIKISNENPTSIYTKLKNYPYEFEINSSLQLASIDGIKIASNSDDNTINYKAGIVTIPSCDKNGSVTKNVTFEKPFSDTNYAITVTSSFAGSYWAQASYTVTNKTVNGFTIVMFEWHGTKPAHDVYWMAIPYKN